MKKLIVSVLMTITLLALPMSASAAWNPFGPACSTGGQTSGATACQPQVTSNPLVGPNGLLIRIIHIVALIAGAAAVILILVGGLKYVTSSGDPQAVESAKNTVLYALIGLAVIAVGQAIISFVLGKL